MQAFVVRNDLLIESDTSPVHVVASYPNAMVTTIGMHGSANTLLVLADNLIANPTPDKPGLPTLKKQWRDDYVPVLNAEAARRINLSFPEYKQRNYTAQYQDYITQHGADTTTWPPDALTFKAEYDRAWAFVRDVRTASNAWTAMPIDPTDDSIWPTQIAPVA